MAAADEEPILFRVGRDAAKWNPSIPSLVLTRRREGSTSIPRSSGEVAYRGAWGHVCSNTSAGMIGEREGERMDDERKHAPAGVDRG